MLPRKEFKSQDSHLVFLLTIGTDDDDTQLDFFNFCLKAGNKKICVQIADGRIWNDNLTVISLRGIHLSPSDVEHLTMFLTQSPRAHQERKEVDLCGCSIGDKGIAIFHQGVKHLKESKERNISIKMLSLSNNNLTESSSGKVFEIATCCKVEMLALRHNPTIGNDPKLYSIISDPDSMVEELNLSHTISKQTGTPTELFLALEKNKRKKLRVLWLDNNNLTDNECDAIVKVLQNNTSLMEFNIYRNPFTITSALKIVDALVHNNTLQYLTLPWYAENNQER